MGTFLLVRWGAPLFCGAITQQPGTEGSDHCLRLGQGTFRVLITGTYGRCCAVTREKALPVLQAAHIRPVSEGSIRRVDNGLLLRSDVHTLFNRGYLTVTPAFKLRVSRRLRDDFDNGEHYYQYEKSDLWVPGQAEDRPGAGPVLHQRSVPTSELDAEPRFHATWLKTTGRRGLTHKDNNMRDIDHTSRDKEWLPLYKEPVDSSLRRLDERPQRATYISNKHT